MPMNDTPKSGMPAGALPMLILRVLQSGSLHGYALAQRIHILSSEVLAVEEGLLYPTLQKMLIKGASCKIPALTIFKCGNSEH